MGAGGNDFFIQRVDEIRRLRRAARGDLDDRTEPALFVAGIDALGRVADVETAAVVAATVTIVIIVTDAGQARFGFEHGYAVFFGAAGVDGGFVDDDIARRQLAANAGAGAQQGGQVGAARGVNGRGHGSDVNRSLVHVCFAVGQAKTVGHGSQLCAVHFAAGVVPLTDLINALGVNIKSDDAVGAGQFDGQRQPDVAQPDNGDGGLPGFKLLLQCFKRIAGCRVHAYSTVTDLARFLGRSTSVPLSRAT